MDGESDSEATGSLARKRLRPTSNGKARAPASDKLYYPKKRVNIACQVCRQRKTRCDAVRPMCGFCTETGAECIYRTPDLSDQRPHETRKSAVVGAHPEGIVNQRDVITRLSRIEALLQNSPLTAGHHFASAGDPVAADASPETYSITVCPMIGSAEPFISRPRIGENAVSTAVLYDEVRPQELLPLLETDTEKQIQYELFNADGSVSRQPYVDITALDLSHRICWQLQQAFFKDVLPWCPILDQQACSDLVSRMAGSESQGHDHETRMALFILALGSISSRCSHLEDGFPGMPGLDYFNAGCQINASCSDLKATIQDIQSHVLKAFYLLQILRPVQSHEALSHASGKIFTLLHMRQLLEAEPALQESVNRAYWACYLFEYELQHFIPHSARVISEFHEDVPLPMSSYDEPGIYWFVAEIALRRIVARPLNGICWNLSRTRYEPAIGLELSSQVDRWQENLPSAVSFPLSHIAVGAPISMRPLLDPHRVFLRAQYYALQAAILWPNVVRLLCLSTHASDSHGTPIYSSPGFASTHDTETQSRLYMPSASETSSLAEATARCIHFAVLHSHAVEPLLQSRHLFLMVDMIGLNCMTLLLLCTFDVEKLRDTVPPHPQAADAIRTGRRCFKIWEDSPVVRDMLHRIEGLMIEKRIDLE